MLEDDVTRRTALGGIVGAVVAATRADRPLSEAPPLAISASGGADISARLTAAIALAGGRKIVIPPGIWTAKNVNVTGAWLEFAEGAIIHGTLGADENLFHSLGGTRLDAPRLEVSNTAPPFHGGYGNIIGFGSFNDTGERYRGLYIRDPVLVSRNNSAYGLAISCLGRCENVRITGTARFIGRFAAAFQAHWGGIHTNPEDLHYGMIEESYHPNDIRIDTMSLEIGGPYNRFGYLGLSLSAAYDVEVKSIVSDGWNRPLWVQPGDVYDLVAVPDQKAKIMSGIRIDYLEIRNPPQNESTYSAALVSGLSATIRVKGQTELVSANDRGNMDVELKNVRVLLEAGHSYNSAPIVRLHYAKNSRINVTFAGFEEQVTASLAQAVTSTDCEFLVKGAGTANAFSAHSNVGNVYRIDWDTLAPPRAINTSHRAVVLGSTAGTATVDTSVAAGATSIAISSWSSVSSQYFIRGTRLYVSDTEFITLRRTQLVGTGVTSIDIDPAPLAIAESASLSVSCRELGSQLHGKLIRSWVAIELVNTDGIDIAATCHRSIKYDVLCDCTTNRRPLFSGSINVHPCR